ncbi:MAG: aquaporin, partial [Ilumatobacteraceae bacterium]
MLRARDNERLLLNSSLYRRLAAEALGTGLLIVAVIGSGIMAERLTTDIALRILCNAVATGGAIVALIVIFGPVSGASFN